MTKIAEKTAALIDSLPAAKAREVFDFARSLADRADEEAWEKSFSNPRAATKLRKLADKAIKEFNAGKTRPLDPDKL
jgi:ribosomal protein L22